MYRKKASPWKRIGAYVLDSIILSIIFSICMFISVGLYLIAVVFGSFLYYGICEGSSLHGSLGKRMCGLMVVDERGYPLTYSKSFVRSLCRLLSGLTLGIGFLIGLFQENGKTLHDQLAHTSVTDRLPESIRPQPERQPQLERQPVPAVGPAPPVQLGADGRGTCPMIICVSGPLCGRTFSIGRLGLVDIGRSPGSCAVVFPMNSKGVSRRHCRVQFDSQRQMFLLYDLGSTYGTMLSNGTRVSSGIPETLYPGDEFWIGSPENRFRVAL